MYRSQMDFEAAAFQRLGEHNAARVAHKDDTARADALLLVRAGLSAALSGSTLLQMRAVDLDQWAAGSLALAEQFPLKPQDVA